MSSQARHSLESLDRIYCEHALQSPALASPPVSWRGTSVSIAGVPLLIGAGEIEEIVETPEVTTIPGTKAWVLGVAAHLGGLLPIISGDVFFRRRPYAGRVREFCMVVRRPGFYFGITLSEVERDLKFPVDQLDTEQAVDTDFAAFTRGGFHHLGRFLAILDIEKLVADGDLSNAAATDTEATEAGNDE